MASMPDPDRPFQFTGRENDGIADLYYYRARYYSPGQHRFLSPDSIGFFGGDTNLYSYVFDDPLNFTDPTGESVGLALKGIAVGLAASCANGAAVQGGAALLSFGRKPVLESAWEGCKFGAAFGAFGAVVKAGLNASAQIARAVARIGNGARNRAPAQISGGSGAPAGNYRPPDPLPSNAHGAMQPSSPYPHTQLGTETSRKAGDYTAAREWGPNGQPIRDINFTDHGRPWVPGHTNPHQHRHIPNPTGGTPRRGEPEPFTW
jgi:RHS repeat-associated protein